MRRWYWLTLASVAGAGAITMLVLLALPKPPIPHRLQKQLTSTLFVPTSGKINHGSAKYDPQLRLLSYIVTAQGDSVTVSEQASPESFTDVPQAYQKVVDGMNDYSDFDTGIGTVHLTRPASLHGKQAAVLNAKGTLMFAKPDHDLSIDRWRRFFNSFDVESANHW
jgi:hypothetical protein